MVSTTAAKWSGLAALPDGSEQHAVLWENGEIVDLGGLGGVGEAYGINNKGQVVGKTGSPECRPFIWDPSTGTMQVLDNPFGGGHSVANSINENGLVVGSGQEPDFPIPVHAFIYDSNTGEFTRIGPEGTESIAWDINNIGQVVGVVADDRGDHGFLYRDGQLYYLEDLIPPDSGWRNILVATAINDAGQIAGTGVIDSISRTHAFLLTPVAALADMTSPVPGLTAASVTFAGE